MVEAGEEVEGEEEEEAMAEVFLFTLCMWRSAFSSCFLQKSNGVNNIVVSRRNLGYRRSSVSRSTRQTTRSATPVVHGFSSAWFGSPFLFLCCGSFARVEKRGGHVCPVNLKVR